MSQTVISSPVSGPTTPKGLPKQDPQTVAEILDCWIRARDGQREWALSSSECIDFVEGRQWTQEEKEIMVEEGRPMVTLNKIAPLTRLVKGYMRNNKKDVRFLPNDEAYASESCATCLTALSKQTDSLSSTEFNNSEVFADGVLGGRGFFDTRLHFEDNVFGDCRERVLDPHAVYIDPEATSYDPEDWGFVQHAPWMSVSDVQNVFGEAASQALYGSGIFGNFPIRSDMMGATEPDIAPLRSFGLDDEKVRVWQGMGFGSVQAYSIYDHINRERKLIRVVESQRKMWTKGKFFIDMETGDKRCLPDSWTKEQIAGLEDYCRQNNVPFQMAEGTYKRIKWQVTAGDVLLYDDWSLYRRYTVTPYFAYFRRGVTRGMVHDLLDPQREVNKRRSNFLHILTTMAHSGWMYPDGTFDAETEEMIESQGGRPGINLKYNADVGKPERIQPGIPSRGHQMAEEKGAQDLMEIAGINASALGQLDRVQSGRAILARQQSSVMGAEEIFDNWDRTIEMRAKNRLMIYQDYYTEPRIVRMRGSSRSQDQTLQINTQGAAGEIVNNIAVGKYAVAVDTVSMSAAFKEGQFTEAVELQKMGVPMPPDVMIDLSSMPDKDRIKQEMQAQQQAKQQEQAQEPQPPAPGFEGTETIQWKKKLGGEGDQPPQKPGPKPPAGAQAPPKAAMPGPPPKV